MVRFIIIYFLFFIQNSFAQHSMILNSRQKILGECEHKLGEGIKVSVSSQNKSTDVAQITVSYPDSVTVEEEVKIFSIGNKIRVVLERAGFISSTLGWNEIEFDQTRKKKLPALPECAPNFPSNTRL
jgi:hypothetical protein